ncbi:MAG: FAD-linked oxidase [Acidobacteria bacterium RIFCSPLOWO2_02_FULL_67_36]|nr:MAG: FAD-linked oxidase [Acidobacteria bacterium RIFCSPLOWO2_02_FULL_67_36]OFW20233.1 MAG: FAD-linked oxidase [Acidobacteria bacterium RIFCSPLOWO2_12_FULL_66_21]
MSEIRRHLETFLAPDQILDREIDCVAYASDASFYRLVPKAVVRPRSIEDVQRLFRYSRSWRIPLTFRAAGTSLSGQAVTDGLLIDLSRHWRSVEPLDGGRRVRVQPGVVGSTVNRVLAPFAARLGPDPASIDACMMGGILSNNASGMCCGVSQNSYHTLDSLVFVLPSGSVVDTADPEAAARLAEREPGLVEGVASLRDRIRATSALAARIREKYRIKNTVGYSLNAFVDFEEPLDILAHLLIGAEGTLAFIAGAVLRTVPDLPVKYTGLLLFASIEDACGAIGPLASAGAAALELMDRAAMRSVQDLPGVPAALASLPPSAAGLLVEFQEPAGTFVEVLVARAAAVMRQLPLIVPGRFTADPAEQAQLWKIRKGMFPSVGAVRQRGTTVIIEDVAFPVAALAPAVVDLQALFDAHGYRDAIVFGHAKDGNLHFVLTQSFGEPAQVARYERFMADVVTLVVTRYDGSLKGEHGTGRNMAPFVETEWGGDAYDIMKRVKALVDPDGLLNPGVIINPNPRAHLTDLKSLPVVEEEIDRCTECGFCELRCPSRDLTLTPRQRIAVRRAIAREPAAAGALARAFEYDGVDTCATDGLCALACPVGIDTGQLVKRLRAARHSTATEALAGWTARHFTLTARTVRGALAAGRHMNAMFGEHFTASITRRLGRAARRALPLWIEPIPLPASRLPQTKRDGAVAVYFPSCLTRTLGELPGEPRPRSTAEAFVATAARAGLPLHIPEDIDALCCGTPYSSKGFEKAHAIAVNRAIDRLWQASNEGQLPIVVDTSPCAYGLRNITGLTPANRERAARMTIVDAVEYFASEVLPHLYVRRRAASVTLHPVCSLVKMGLAPKFSAIAEACSARVFVPPSAGCCAFAGDRGWLVPELTASATAAEAAEVHAEDAEGWYSSSRTCELGMIRATGRNYRSWIHLLDWATGT